MKKDFEQRVIREKVVDTAKYRYMYISNLDDCCIIRIERKYLDTTVASNGWKMVRDYMLPDGKSYPRECGNITKKEKVILNGTEHYAEDVATYMDDDIREEMNHEGGWNSEQEFLDEYVRRHEEKFGEDFDIV